jgi:tetratricopeptide (TPR) repeat protein
MTTSGRDLLKEALQAFQTHDRDRAAALLIQLDAQAPPLGDSWGPVSRLAFTLGEVSVAIAAIRRYVALSPHDKERRLAYGALLAGAGRIEGAMETMRAFLPHTTVDARLMLFIGTCRAQLGHNDLAFEDLRAGLDLAPTPTVTGALWLAIADLKRFEAGDPDIAAMERAAADPAASSALLYALAKAWDDVGQPDKAFALYERGASLARRQRPFAAQASSAFVDQIIANQTPASLAALPTSGITSERPIFVLGLPRSGTTLVEQMLVSHSGVMNGAELNLFRTATMALGDYSPEALAAFTGRADAAQAWTAMGQAYLHLLDERFGPEGKVVDKTLNHSRLVGVIRSILPKARFIWLRRDPGDTALSCYRSHFAEGVNWSWSMADIGRHFADEDRLYAHWTSLYPDAILTVPYEALVAEPDAWINRILDHCGLTFEAPVRHFHLTQRPVATTSSSQVRQPIHGRSVGGWRRYAQQMAPFFQAYGTPAPD